MSSLALETDNKIFLLFDYVFKLRYSFPLILNCAIFISLLVLIRSIHSIGHPLIVTFLSKLLIQSKNVFLQFFDIFLQSLDFLIFNTF